MRYKETNQGDKVFESREITNAVVAGYSEYFSKLFKSLGIMNFTFHNLRHTFSSLLQSDLGVGAVVVQGMTGHSSLSMLQKYSHTGLINKQQAIKSFHGFQGVCLAKVKIWVLYLLNLPSFYFISHTFCIGIEQCITWRDKAAIQSPLKKGDEGA
mgnify:CR=1 FL=1